MCEEQKDIEKEEVVDAESPDVKEAGEAAVDSEESVESEEATEEKVEEDFKAKYYYLAAEMENMRRRFNREKESLLKYGNEKVLSSLVDVLDSLDHTITAIEEDEDDKVQNIVKGVDMVRTQFLEALKKNGLEKIDSLGKEFDPNFHEAMAQQPAEGKNDQEIIMEYQRGYTLNGRLLRASKVVIAKN